MALFDPLFGFLLAYNPVLSVTIFSIVVLVLINIFYKILINQDNAKAAKERTKELSKKMKEAQKAGDTKKSSELLSEMMKENGKIMRMTLKPMIISFIIVIILLPWLSDNFGDRFAALENNAGKLSMDGKEYPVVVQDGKLASPVECSLPCTESVGGKLVKISNEGGRVKFAPIVAMLPVSLPFLGNNMGWLGWYIFVSIPLVVVIRKLMKIYV